MFRLLLVITAGASVLGYPSVRHQLSPRIVGGDDTQIEQMPYQAAVLFFEYLICGGTILNDMYVITAASCTNPGGSFNVRVGSTNFHQGGVVIPVFEVHQHPWYTPSTREYDLSILELDEPMIYSAAIQPMKLPEKDVVPADGTVGIISGWGFEKFEMGNLQKVLQSAHVPIFNHEQCAKIYISRGTVTENMICAGYYGTGGRDACLYDSGGPFIVDNKLVGIISWGVDCGHPDWPGVYTNVAKFLPWIRRVSRLDDNCKSL